MAFEKMGHAIDLAALANNNDAVARLFDTWYRAEQVYLVAGRQDDRRWAVIEYARLLEDISNQQVPVVDVAEHTGKVMELRASLLVSLSAATTAEEVRVAVKTASDAIAAIRREVTRLRIAAAGEILDVGSDAVDAAQRTWTLRSREAAHARAGAISDDQVYWARAAAAVFLFGYLKRTAGDA